MGWFGEPGNDAGTKERLSVREMQPPLSLGLTPVRLWRLRRKNRRAEYASAALLLAKWPSSAKPSLVPRGYRICAREKERWCERQQSMVPHVSPCWGPTHERTGLPSAVKPKEERS